jgi:hypothetical protein
MTKDEWDAQGQRLFGPDKLKWRFKCPVCGNVQTPEDFMPYKELGATPESALKECIGRYSGAKSVNLSGKKSPCDYAGYGFFKLSPVRVQDGEHEYHVFAFAEPENEDINENQTETA